MPERPSPDRLDADVIAAYLDGQLSPGERAAVEARLAADPDTYEWVASAMRTIEEMEVAGSPADAPSDAPDVSEVPRHTVVPMPPEPRLPFHRQRTFRAVIGGVLAAAAAWLLVVQVNPAWWRQLTGRDDDPRFARLVAAVGNERYVEGRLAGGFHYGPLRSVTRGPGDLSNQNLALLAAAGELQKAAQAEPTAGNLHAWGVAQVLLGDWTGAVASLDAALTAGGEPPDVLTALSAALIARGDALDQAEDYARALSLVTRALDRAPDDTVALFNRGLALNRLHMAREAVTVWDRYLSLDADSPWSSEATRLRAEMLDALQQSSGWQRWEPPRDLSSVDAATLAAAVESAPDRVRQWFDTVLLPDLARPDRPADPRQWPPARIVAAALERLTGDTLPGAMLTDLERLPSVEARHVAAHAAFAAAGVAQARGQAGPFRDAVRRLEQADLHDLPGLAEWRTLFRGQLALRERRYEQAARLLGDWLASAPADAAPVLAARAEWAAGLSLANQSDHAGALAAFHRARDLFERVGDTVSLGRLESQLAAMYSLLGSESQAWRHRRQALAAAAVTGDPLLQDAVYNNVFVTALDNGLLETAGVFVDALNDAATRGELVSSRLQAKVRRGWLDYRRGRMDAARQHLDEAAMQLASIDDDAMRRAGDSMVTVLATAVDLQHGDAPSALARANDESLANARTALERATLLLLRSSARQAVGDVVAAETDLRAAVDIAGSGYRGDATLGLPEFERDLIWNGLERFVDASLRQDDAASALAAVDRARRRLSALPVHGPDDTSVEALRRVMPDDTAILYCVPFASRTAAWVVTARHVHAQWVAIGAAEIASHHARALRHLQQRDDATAVAVFATLGERLVVPLEGHLGSARRLRVVADGVLAAIPFGLLATTSGPLQARHVVSYAAALPWREERTAAAGAVDAVVVGDPAFDPALFPGLTRLPGARREARAIAASYGRAIVLENGAATTPAVIDALGKGPRVVHFAGHAVADAHQPLASSLLLSPASEGEVGTLALRRLLPALVGHPIVVLTACSTARALSSRLSPTVTFASGLVAAGASAVVGTLWDLPDGDVSPVIRQLHDALAAGEQPDVALAQAQAAAGRTGAGLLGWAGLVVYERGI